MKSINKIWIFSDSIAGHELQSVALSKKLTDEIELYHCGIRQPWLSFAPRLLPRFGRNIIWENKIPDTSNPAEIIVTCGRRMAAVGKYYKNLCNARHIQILCPGDNPQNYDILICPEHDRLKGGSNTIKIKGSLHNISVKSLMNMQCTEKDSNSVSLLLGNPGNKFFKNIKALALQVQEYFPKNKLRICASRRTPQQYYKPIREAFNFAEYIWFNENDGNNPYMNLLACSSVLIVTADSVNMISEACATNKSVIIIGTDYVSPKHQRFIHSLKGRVSKFNEGSNVGNIEPLNTLEHVVKRVCQILEP